MSVSTQSTKFVVHLKNRIFPALAGPKYGGRGRVTEENLKILLFEANADGFYPITADTSERRYNWGV